MKKLVVLIFFLFLFNITVYPNSLGDLISSTFIGGSGSDRITGLVTDLDGNIFAICATDSLDLPINENSYDSTHNGYTDLYIVKFDSQLKTVLASSYLGGSGTERNASIFINQSGDVVVSGYTSSSDFPTTNSAYQQNYIGKGDGFICILDSNLSTILASTYIGGSTGSEYILCVVQDSEYNYYAVGRTASSDFPTNENSFDKNFQGDTDGFVIKLDNSLSTKIASTYIGGESDDAIEQIILSLDGSLFLSGNTRSSLINLGIQTSINGYDIVNEGGNSDVVILKMDKSLSNIIAATLFGGNSSNSDYGSTLIIDSSNNILVGGKTLSTDLPTNQNSYDQTFNGDWDLYIAKFNSDLTTLINCTYLGGAANEEEEIHLFKAENKVIATGRTEASDFPLTEDAERTISSGNGEGFICIFDENLSTLEYSTFIGGSDYDGATSVQIDKTGNVFVAGYTYSNDFQNIINGYDTSFNGKDDGFLIKYADPVLYTYNIAHIAENNWITALDVYNPTDTEITFYLDKWNNSIQEFENRVFSVTAKNHVYLNNDNVGYYGVAKLKSENNNLKVKLIYNFIGSESLSEFFVPNDMESKSWLIPNSIKEWFDWFGIALCNFNQVPVTVTLNAYYQGDLVGEKIITINSNDKYVDLSTNIWQGTSYSDIDMVIIESDKAISPPLSISGNNLQDRHVFFLGQCF